MSLSKVITNDFLKEKMDDAMVFRGHCDVLENAKQPGYYQLDAYTTSTSQGLPPGWNITTLEVLKRGSEFIQRLTRIDGDWMAVRVYRQGEWKPFRILNFPS